MRRRCYWESGRRCSVRGSESGGKTCGLSTAGQEEDQKEGKKSNVRVCGVGNSRELRRWLLLSFHVAGHQGTNPTPVFDAGIDPLAHSMATGRPPHAQLMLGSGGGQGTTGQTYTFFC